MNTPNTSLVFDVRTAEFAEHVVQASHEQPVLVDFWASWCGPCRTLAPVLERLAAAYGGAFVLAKVDTEAEQALAGEHGIRSLPTVRLYSNGQVVDEFMGMQPESVVRAMLDRHIERASDRAIETALTQTQAGDTNGALQTLQQALIDDPANVRIHPAFASVLITAGALDDASAVLDALPHDARETEEVRQLYSRIALARSAEGGEDEAELRERLAANPRDCQARVALSGVLTQDGQHAAAMDELLEVVRIERGFKDGIARQRLLQLFDVLGTDPIVPEYRRKLAQALF